MPICAIVGCSNRPGVQKELSFFKIPKIITGQGEDTKKLSEERRRIWKAAINRADIQTEEKWERTIVCSKHFVGGVKAYLHDRTNPSWCPTLCLGTPGSASPSVANKVARERFKRASERKEKRVLSEAASSLLSLKKRRIEFCTATEQEHQRNEKCEHTESASGFPLESDFPLNEISSAGNSENTQTDKDTQTELTSSVINSMEKELRSSLEQPSSNTNLCMRDLYNISYYEKNAESVPFYTGLPNIGVLIYVFNFVKDYLPESSKVLTKEEQYLICLVKLRMNYLFKDIANHLNVSLSTVQRGFHNTLDVLYIRLKFLVRWPQRENVRKTMPMSFRKDFGTKVIVVLDCFELFTERPSGAENKVFTYSNYKHHQTIKYLIGVAPQGVVTFISEGWGGRTSDKYITEKSSILDNLLPGDIVMADRGFCIEESVRFYGAELVIPSFTRGKSQLHPLDVEKTRKIASVRIHVERVIGLILRKFRIFEGLIPLEFIKLRNGEQIPTIDKIVRVACCLTNLCPSVVPFD